MTRATLIDAAEKVFLREGFEHASVEQITEAAGFSRGAFYSNFSDKDDLALAVIDKRRREVARALRDVAAHLGSGKQRAAIRDWFSKQCRQTDWISLRLEFDRRAQRNPALESAAGRVVPAGDPDLGGSGRAELLFRRQRSGGDGASH